MCCHRRAHGQARTLPNQKLSRMYPAKNGAEYTAATLVICRYVATAEASFHHVTVYLKSPFLVADTLMRSIAAPLAMRPSTCSAISGSKLPLRM
jgi:hypothetical protein